jgi:hypothetical protein
VQICAPTTAIRYAATNALINYAHPAVIRVMRQALSDNRIMVRIHAIAILQAYKYVPTIHEAICFLRYGKSRYIGELLPLILDGDSHEIITKLHILHDNNLFVWGEGYYKPISAIIKKHPQAAILVHDLLASGQLFFVRLGLISISDSLVDHALMHQLQVLQRHPLSAVREAVQKYLRTLFIRQPALVVHYWSILSIIIKESFIRHVIGHTDCTVRALALTDEDLVIRIRCIRFLYLCITAHPDLIYQLTAPEITQIATWQSIELIENRHLIIDITTTWQQHIAA